MRRARSGLNVEGPARLALWLEEREIPQRELARVMDVTPTSVCEWLAARKVPTEPFRQAIERWTSGGVPAASWATADELELAQWLACVEPWRGSA